MRKYFPLIFSAPIIGIVMLVCLSMLISGRVSLTTNGFAVDAEGLLYVGREHEIIVLSDGVCVRTINPQTSRSYKFTISDGQTILLSTSTKVYTMDLSGNILTEHTDDGTKIYNQLQWKRSFIDENGVKYTLESRWGRTCICKEGEPIYQMPMLDYVVRILLVVIVVVLLVVGISIMALRVPKAKKI